MDQEISYRQWSALIATMPTFSRSTVLSDQTQRWLGRCYALLDGSPRLDAGRRDRRVAVAFKIAWDKLGTMYSHDDGIREIKGIAYRAFAQAEAAAPTSLQGSFIAAGNPFDAFASIGKLLAEVTRTALIIDPYMDETILTDFAQLVPTGIVVQLLTDGSSVKESLKPAVTRWIEQYGDSRPLEARVSPPRLLHDRSIILDGAKAWVLTQSFKDLAARSPASVSLLDPDSSALKVRAYQELWEKSASMT